MSTSEANLVFSVGEHVVYPAHGVGQVVGEETQTVGGLDIGVYVISFDKEKMVLRVPIKRAVRAGLRRLSTAIQVEKSIKILRGKARTGRGMWSRRAQEYEQKINSGVIMLIAEVVRDLHKNVDDPDRSYSERMIYEAALERLLGEVSVVREITLKDATIYVEEILKKEEVAA